LEYKNSIIEQIGNTPLIKLNRINRGLQPLIFAKLELAIPGVFWEGKFYQSNLFSSSTDRSESTNILFNVFGLRIVPE
jgi:hypothetical protein